MYGKDMKQPEDGDEYFTLLASERILTQAFPRTALPQLLGKLGGNIFHIAYRTFFRFRCADPI